MLTISLKLHDANVELPEKSGEYIVIAENCWLSRTGFSQRWGKFNVADDERDLGTAIDVFYWAEIPEELMYAVRGKELLMGVKNEEE